MTISEAVRELRSVGHLSAEGDRIICRLPRRKSPAQQTALDVVRRRKSEALVFLGNEAEDGQAGPETPETERTLNLIRKGQAVCLACDILGENLWIVADQEDAALLQTQEPGASCYDMAEVEILAALRDPEIVRELHQFKRALPGGRFTRSGGREKL